MTPELWAAIIIGAVYGIVAGLMLDDWIADKRNRD
jgi:Na+/H+-dicarboxylate symporter